MNRLLVFPAVVSVVGLIYCVTTAVSDASRGDLIGATSFFVLALGIVLLFLRTYRECAEWIARRAELPTAPDRETMTQVLELVETGDRHAAAALLRRTVNMSGRRAMSMVNELTSNPRDS